MCRNSSLVCEAQHNFTVCRLCLQLTGGGGIYNINNGVVVKGTIAFNNATTLVTTYNTTEGKTKVRIDTTSGPVSFKGLFGCTSMC
jgi:hypothetical protein